MTAVRRRWEAHKGWISACWVIAVLTGAAHFLLSRYDQISETFAAISLGLLAAATASIAVAKLGLTATAKLAADRFSDTRSFGYFFYAYNSSQLAKYLPGGLWQYAGRVAIYRDGGFSFTAIRDALVAETAWTIAGAALVSIAALPLVPGIMRALDLRETSEPIAYLMVAALVIAGAVAVLLPQSIRYGIKLLPNARIGVVQLLVWTTLGAHLSSLITACTGESIPMYLAIGLFGFSYLAGYVVPFAPAGLGVREAVIVAGLSAFFPIDLAATIAVLSRLLYFGTEILMALVGYTMARMVDYTWRAP
jgi:uncharacterized membrane protein YbhN (UPF0104 family)